MSVDQWAARATLKNEIAPFSHYSTKSLFNVV